MGAQLTPAADVYSVGVILYELLTGNVPFVAESFMGILARHVRDQPLDPRQAAPGRQIPDSVAALCMRLLAKEPGARPSAEALADELRGLLARERPQLAAARVGAEHELAGPGDDTQVFDDPSEPRLAERETLAPGEVPASAASVSGPAAATVELALAPSDSSERGRSNTAIGHASAAMSASTGAVGRVAAEPSVVVEPEPRSDKRLGLVIGLVAGGLVLVGGLAFALSRVNQEPAGTDAPAVEVADEDASVPEPEASAEIAAGSDEPGPAPLTDESAQDSQTGETGEPAEEVAEPAPEPEAAKTPREPSKGKSKPKPKPETKPKPDPDPEPETKPEPEAKPDPPAPDPGDSQLPTIKDDVYD